MHRPTTKRRTVLDVLQRSQELLETSRAQRLVAAGAKLNLRSSSDWQVRRDQIVEELQSAHRWAAREQTIEALGGQSDASEDPWYVPRNQTIALVQSAMESYLEAREVEAKKVRKDQEEIEAEADAVFEKFDPTDAGWIEVLWEKLKLLFSKKARFIRHKSTKDFVFELPSDSKIALVADWGSGTIHAKAVMDQIKTRKPDHVIHLGDVYYAGTRDEIRKRFLKEWPKGPAPPRSWALNSNHEMYSGGHGYFGLTLKIFQQPASYFRLGNQYWRFLALDTGYIDHNLNHEQVNWLSAQVNDGRARTILLSHHQLFSAYQGQGENLEKWLTPFFEKDQIYAWFWGHEHKCIVYDNFKRIKGRCIGHGGIPYLRVPDAPANAADRPRLKWVNRRGRPDDAGRGIHGFAMLTLKGPTLTVEYVDEDGVVSHSETL